MGKFKKQIVFLFGGIALITYLSFRFALPQESSVSMISSENAQAHMQIYLPDKAHTLVPLSIPVSEETSEEEKIQLMFSYMSGKQQIKEFRALFQKECILKNVKLEAGIAYLYFDASLKNYQKEDELMVLEAITWGTTQFHDVEQVKLFLNRQELQVMPLANTPIPEVLNRSIGINHFESATLSLHDSTSRTVYATKKIEGTQYLIPRSCRIPNNNQTLTEKVQSVLNDISASSELKQVFAIEDIQIQGVKLENKTLIVDLNKNLFDSDTSVKQNVYDSLVLSLATLPEVEQVQVRVGGKSVAPNKQTTKAVSKYDLNYNGVKF